MCARAMELLLALLSLLTAATGAVAAGHAPETGVHQAAGIVAVAPARQAAARPAIALAAPTSRPADAPPARVDTPAVATAPLYADRRRE
jgi:hypothetical protein